MEGTYQNIKTLLYREKTSEIETQSLKHDFSLNGVKSTHDTPTAKTVSWEPGGSGPSQTFSPLAVAACHHVPRAGWAQS